MTKIDERKLQFPAQTRVTKFGKTSATNKHKDLSLTLILPI
jgi:hypothetical protein